VQNSDIVKRKKRRSKRRSIFCPVHNCYLDSASKKYRLFDDQPGQLQARGVNTLAAQMLIKSHTTIGVTGEWVEAFWCEECQETIWYHVYKIGDRSYKIAIAPDALWQSVGGVVHPNGNPSVSEFTRNAARMKGYQGLKAFNTIS
jgi:hypothetical protein